MKICFVYCSKLERRNVGFSEQHPCRLSRILGDQAKVYAMYCGSADESLFRKHGVIPLRFHSKLMNLGNPGSLIALIYHTWRIGRKHEIDIFMNVWSHYFLFPIWIGAKFSNRRAAASIGGVPISKDYYRRHKNLGNIIRKKIGLFMERKSLQAVHSIHLVANYLKSEYAERGVPLKKMQVISRGVNVEDIDSLLTYSEPMVGEFNLGTVGRIHPMKDIETIIKGFEIFNNKYRNCYLHIVGNGSMEYISRLSQMVSNRGLQDKIIFHGLMPYGEIFQFLSRIDLFVLASKSEGIANVVLEALACGLPVIATNVGDIPIHLEEGRGFLFNKGEYRKLSELIEIVYLNREEPHEIRNNRKNYVRDKHSFSSLRKKYLEFFENALY